MTDGWVRCSSLGLGGSSDDEKSEAPGKAAGTNIGSLIKKTKAARLWVESQLELEEAETDERKTLTFDAWVEAVADATNLPKIKAAMKTAGAPGIGYSGSKVNKVKSLTEFVANSNLIKV